jgi:uncharacterized membrane-anchored protein
MDKRARQQLHLQTAVERLSTVAICYYAVQLLDKALTSLAAFYPPLPLPILQALSLPLVMLSTGWVWYRLQKPATHTA